MDSMVVERNKTLFIRADANTRMGTGHVMRCMALGQAWQDAGGSVCFICAEIPDGLAERVKLEGFELIRLDVEKGSPEDLRRTIAVLKSSTTQQLNNSTTPTSQWLVTDGYHFDLGYQRGLRAAGIKLLLIDDYNHLPEYEADILLNQNIGAEEIDYRCNPNCRKLLGTKYVMLRREFRTLERRERNFPDIGTRLLVTLGGADPDNVTLKVIEALKQLNLPELKVKVIVGPANPHSESLKKVVELSTFDLRLLTDVKDMSGLMIWADLAVSAAGSTCWEFCCLRVPFMTIILAENQARLATEMARCGIADCLGKKPSLNTISNKVQELATDIKKRVRCTELGKELVDGFGIDRVLYEPAKESELNLFDGRLSLRSAVEKDMELFARWANDPSVRSNCYNTAPIPMNVHRAWFAEKLSSANTLMLVLELDGVPVGQIRYDRRGEMADIGFSLDKAFRGLGLGQKIIEQSLGRAFSELEVNAVRAEVFSANTASRIAFVKTGFELLETCEIKGVPSLVFVRKRP
jgi:UDP-2,4-diacetamido-2,4,6-trideoxy-beta-L-altropyranose hydrolase